MEWSVKNLMELTSKKRTKPSRNVFKPRVCTKKDLPRL